MQNLGIFSVDRREFEGNLRVLDWKVDTISNQHLILARDHEDRTCLLHRSMTGTEAKSFPMNFCSSDLVNFSVAGDQLLMAGNDGLIGYFTPDSLCFNPVGQIETGISGCNGQLMWTSPDQEVVAIVSVEKLFLMSNYSCEVLLEISISQLVNSAPHVALGWGAKQTQFHGSEGKQAALNSGPLPTKPSYLHPLFDTNRSIGATWRSDSKYLALSVVEEVPWRAGESVRTRTVYMLSKSGELLGKSEVDWTIVGSNLVAWKPDSLLVAMVAYELEPPHLASSVVFWERNGLRHGGFPLRIPKEHPHPTLVEWNSDASLLMVGWSHGEHVKWIQLYASSNFHWYLKGEFQYETECMAHFHPDNPNVIFRLSLPTSHGTSLLERLVLSRECFADQHSNGTVFVADGAKLLCTPFQKRNVPPPMYDFAIDVGSFVPTGFYSGENCYVFWSTNSTCLQMDKRASTSTTDNFSLTNICEPSFFVCKLVLFNVDFYAVGYSGTCQQMRKNDSPLPVNLPKSPICCLFSGITDDALFFQCENGNLYKLDLGNFTFSLVGRLDFPCNQFRLFAPQFPNLFVAFSSEYCWLAVVLVTENQLETKLKVFNVNSWCSTELGHFLAVSVTSGNELKFYQPQLQPDSQLLLLEHSQRSVEKGAYIVTGISALASIVLGLPRGNLETIYPRPLLLVQIQQNFIQKGAWKQAFEACRKHRIDLNILYETIGISGFIQQLPAFVQQVNRPDWLNLFISSLPTDLHLLSDLLETLRSILIQDSSLFFEPILTCFAKQNKFEEALRMIQSTYGTKDAMYDKMVKYLLFLQPKESFLYRIALGMCDWEGATAIAKRSQMDPKDYQGFINDMSALKDENIVRFTVNDYLEKWSDALSFLVKYWAGRRQNFATNHATQLENPTCGDLKSNPSAKYLPPTLVDYIKRHSLYKQCLFLLLSRIEVHTNLAQEVWICYSEHLVKNGQFLQAALAAVLSGTGDARERALQLLKGSGKMHEYWREIVGLSDGKWISILLVQFKSIKCERKTQLNYHHLLIQQHIFCSQKFLTLNGNAEIISNAEATSNIEMISNAEATSNAEMMSNTKMTSNAERSPNTKVKSIPVDSLDADLQQMLEPLCNACSWLDAYRFSIYNNKCQEFFRTSIINRTTAVIQQCQEIQQTFNKRYTRLLEARESYKRSLEHKSAIASQDLTGVDIDTLSVISHMSILTGTTRASTKSKKRATKAKLRSREGGIYEEDYLLYEIATCFRKLSQLLVPLDGAERAEVNELIECLLLVNRIDLANQVQTILLATCSLLNGHASAVFDSPIFPLGEHDPDYLRPWERPSLLPTNDWLFEFVAFDAKLS